MRSPALRYIKPFNLLPPPPAGSVLWLPGQDDAYSSTIRDRSGANNNGTISGATWKFNGLWYPDFDGADDVTTITDAASIQDIFDSGGTVLAWIKPDTDGEGDNGRIFDKTAGASGTGWMFRVFGEASGLVKLRFVQGFSGGQGSWGTSATCVTIGKFNLVAVTYNSSSVNNNPTVSVNGVTKAVAEDLTPGGTRGSDATTNLLIGNDSAGTSTFDGGIALEILIPGVVWTTAQITNWYNQTRYLFGV